MWDFELKMGVNGFVWKYSVLRMAGFGTGWHGLARELERLPEGVRLVDEHMQSSCRWRQVARPRRWRRTGTGKGGEVSWI
jgi:hypothetical protein